MTAPLTTLNPSYIQDVILLLNTNRRLSSLRFNYVLNPTPCLESGSFRALVSTPHPMKVFWKALNQIPEAGNLSVQNPKPQARSPEPKLFKP